MASLTKNQIKLFEILHNSRMEDFKTFNKRSYRGVWSSIIDKYPESAHFVYELLQNADDAEATEVYIILRQDQMLFKHNGKKHFNELNNNFIRNQLPVLIKGRDTLSGFRARCNFMFKHIASSHVL